MLSKEEIEKARSNILRGNDIESASIILETIVLDNYIETGRRVNILKIATRQILNFIEENKNKGNLDYIKEKVKANNKVQQLELEKQNLIEKLEEESKQFDEQIKEVAIKLNEVRDFVITDEYEQAENEEYILILEEKYEKANTKRIRTNEILEILKGETNERMGRE